MSLPRYPSPGPFGGQASQRSWEQPGSIPLRPLAVGEILGVGVTVLRRHALPLVGAAIALAAASTALTLGVLAATGSLATFADAGWLQDILAGGTTLPAGILLATLLGLVVSTIGAPVIAGIASAYAGAQALGRDGRGAVAERLRGRWPVLLGVALIVGGLVAAGLVVLIIPGVIAYLMLVLAAPAAVMERGSVGASLRRSTALTRGHRARIMGAVAVTLISGSVAGAIVSSFAGAVVGGSGTAGTLVVTELVAVLVTGLANAWTGAVVAVLYIDVRIRSEHLDQALRVAAAADRAAAQAGPMDPAGPSYPAGPMNQP